MPRSDRLRVRVSQLLGLDVVDAAGTHVGSVIDVRLVQDGPLQPSGLARLRVHGLIVSPSHSGRLFGYERRPLEGPWLIRKLVLAYNKGVRYAPWNCVGSWSAGRVELTVAASELAPLQALPTPGTGA
jgi:sporulation protein YlmC with PRC-barrel domain